MRDRWGVSGGVSVIAQAHTNASSDSVQPMQVVAAALNIQDCYTSGVLIGTLENLLLGEADCQTAAGEKVHRHCAESPAAVDGRSC